jgi:hypothetical protein
LVQVGWGVDLVQAGKAHTQMGKDGRRQMLRVDGAVSVDKDLEGDRAGVLRCGTAVRRDEDGCCGVSVPIERPVHPANMGRRRRPLGELHRDRQDASGAGGLASDLRLAT